MNKSILLLFVIFLATISCKKDNGEKAEFYELSLSISPENGGAVEVINAETEVKIEDLDLIKEGTQVKLKATANEGFVFVGFRNTVDFLSSLEPVLEMKYNTSITAVFRSEGNTPVEVYGDLKVQEANIVDSNGGPVQLKGMSLFWSQWKGQYWNADVVDWLCTDWEINVIRAAMGVDEDGGYKFNITERNKVEAIVEAAIDKGIYVIIDWHSHHAENNTDLAVDFFSEMAEKYGSHANVIYEIYNEPLSVSWSATIKLYAEKVIEAIRAKDPDNLIIVGTPNWSQDVDAVIGNEINDDNVAYVLHFYASEVGHYNNLFDKAEAALKEGIPLFVSEWGVSEATGNGNFNEDWTKDWLDFMDKHKLSWCNWSIADKVETSAALLPGANVTGGWAESALSPSGKFVRNVLVTNKGYSNPQ